MDIVLIECFMHFYLNFLLYFSNAEPQGGLFHYTGRYGRAPNMGQILHTLGRPDPFFAHSRYRHDPLFFHFGIEMGGYFGNFDDDIRIFLWVKENRGQNFKTAKFCALHAHSFHNFMPLMPNFFGSVVFLMKTIIT